MNDKNYCVYLHKNKQTGEVVGLSSGTTRKNRIYLTVGKYRSYEQALELCKEHLRLLTENAA